MVFTLSIFYPLISNVAFGQSPQLPIGLGKYEKTLLHEDVRSLLPDFLKNFKESKTQTDLQPHHVDVLLGNPIFFRTLLPELDEQFIALLYLNKDFRTLFGDDQFYRVLKNSNEIDKLLAWFDAQPSPQEKEQEPIEIVRRPTILRIVSGNGQSGETKTRLARPFVVGVLDQENEPLPGITVTFSVTQGNGRLSTDQATTDVYGQARTTLTLGSRAGRHSVTARASGITQIQTFTATAVVPPPPPPPPEPTPPEPMQATTTEQPTPPLHWIANNKIFYRSDSEKTNSIYTPPTGTTLTGGLAVDKGNRRVYWAEKTNIGGSTGRIRSASLDGTLGWSKEERAAPVDIALDIDNGHLYWTNELRVIQRRNLKTGNYDRDFNKINRRETNTNIKAIKHIAFDKGVLFWTETDPKHKEKERIMVRDAKINKIFEDNLNTLGGHCCF